MSERPPTFSKLSLAALNIRNLDRLILVINYILCTESRYLKSFHAEIRKSIEIFFLF